MVSTEFAEVDTEKIYTESKDLTAGYSTGIYHGIMVLRHERTEKSFDREDWFACEIKEIDYQREYTFTVDPANPSEETLMLGGLIFEGSMCLERTVKFVLAFYTSSNPDITND